MIQVEIDGLFAPRLERGLHQSMLTAVLPEILAAHRSLMQRRGDDLGFYDLPLQADAIKCVASEVIRLRSLADDLIVLGVGGSSLGGQALQAALAPTGDLSRRAHFVDNVDPDTLGALLDRLEPARTVAAVVSKSGNTVETLAQLLIVRRWFRASLGKGESRSRMVFITNPEEGLLRDLAREEAIRSLEVPGNVEGRFSALTPVGLLPAAFVGIDIEKTVGGAATVLEQVSRDDFDGNPACRFAAGAILAARALGRSSLVMMPYGDALRQIESWFVQLWAGSLGRRLNLDGDVLHAGQTPIRAMGCGTQHGQLELIVEGPRDKVVVLVSAEASRRQIPIPDELADRPEVSYLHGHDLGDLLAAGRRATRAALLDAGVPVLDVVLPRVDEETMGGLLLLLEAACACTGAVLGINPFGQPELEVGRRRTLGLLGCPGYEEDAAQVRGREAVQNSVS